MSLSKFPKFACPTSRRLTSANYNSSASYCGVLVIAVTFLFTTAAWGQGKILYSFTGAPDAQFPTGGLIRDSAGNLYGASSQGGYTAIQQCQGSAQGCGVVFELSPAGGGTWTESVLHTFMSGSDGANPYGNLVMDSAGNLYGTTQYGGSGCSGFYGCGTVYELSPAGGGTWTETILHYFSSGTDGVYPEAGMIFDGAGNLYGTTGFGGNSACNTLGCGTVFKLTPATGGTWTYEILYVFQGGADGGEPGSSLTFDGAGNLYGTAAVGGTATACNPPYGCGVVYELTPGSTNWTETTLHSFVGAKGGSFPNSGLAIDGLGNLYGNSALGGANEYGYVYKLSPQAGGSFKFTSLYSFDLTHGANPKATPVFSGGVLYGTASNGGGDNRLCSNGCGGVYRLKANGSGGLGFGFNGFGTYANGASPQGSLLLDSSGNLYGTTSSGGAGYGTVFEIMQ